MSGLAELERDRLPVLTEVVELPPDAAPAPHPEPVFAPAVAPAVAFTDAPAVDRGAALEPWASAPPAGDARAVDAEAIVQQVLAALQPRLDAWFEARVREALAPALERVLAGAAAESRAALGASLRALAAEVVAEALVRRAPPH